MIALNQSASAKLPVIWMSNPRLPLRSKPYLRFDLFQFSVVNFVPLE